jgi:hypothetical protein
VQKDPITSQWLIITNPTALDERITLQSGQEKYALIFTQPQTINEFMRDLQDPSLTTESLETWVLKETYLTTLTRLAVTRVMFDYVRGQHQALSAPLELLRSHCQSQIGIIPKAEA